MQRGEDEQPVSAAVSAMRIVSRSRISPTRRQSGSSRIAALTPSAKPGTSVPTSRWVKTDRALMCTNSMGSSIVTTWYASRWLTRSSTAARVVDFPLPVGPVTRTRPLCASESFAIDSRQPQLVDGRDAGGDQAEDGRGAAFLPEEVDAEARDAPHLVGEVDVALAPEQLPETRWSDRAEQVVEVALGQRAEADALELAVDPKHRGAADGEMQVGAVALRKDREETVDAIRRRSDAVSVVSDGLRLFCRSCVTRPLPPRREAALRTASLRSARRWATRGSITPSLHQVHERRVHEHHPEAAPVCIAVGSWNVFPSRISPATFGVLRRTSKAATRPEPSRRGRSVWERTALQGVGDHHPDLALLLRGERVDDAVDRRARRRRVERPQHEMARSPRR